MPALPDKLRQCVDVVMQVALTGSGMLPHGNVNGTGSDVVPCPDQNGSVAMPQVCRAESNKLCPLGSHWFRPQPAARMWRPGG